MANARSVALSVLILALAVTAAGPQQAEAALFNPETFTLDNGMQVVVVTDRRAAVVSHHVWYKVGSADSPPGKSGLPHFLEHLMFKALRTLRPASSRRSSRATAATRTRSPAPTTPATIRPSPGTGSSWSWRWKPTA